MDFILREAQTQIFPSQNIILLPSSKTSDLRFILEQRLQNKSILEDSKTFDIKSTITQSNNSLNETLDRLNNEETSILTTQTDTSGLLEELLNKKNVEKQKIIFLKKKRKEKKK